MHRTAYLEREVKLLTSYRTREAVLLPSGTRMRVTAAYRNRYTLQALENKGWYLHDVHRGAFELVD